MEPIGYNKFVNNDKHTGCILSNSNY